MNDKMLVDEGVKQAQEAGRGGQFKVGQVVAHPSDKLAYEFRGERNGLAVLGLTAEQHPRGKAVEKEFPLDEVFDPKVVLEKALEAKSEALAKKFPGAVVIRFGL